MNTAPPSRAGLVAALVLVAVLPASAHAADADLGVAATQVSEGWVVARGGARTGSVYLDHQHVELDVADAHFAGSQSLGAHLGIAGGNGGCATCLSGDAQGVSNIEGIGSWRLYELWLDWIPGGDTGWRAGLYDLNSEFDSIETVGLFINSSHGVGPTLGLSGLNGPSIFPVTALALRVQQARDGHWWQIAALDAVPGTPEDPDHPALHLGGSDGALLVAEAGRGGADTVRYGLGAWQYTGAFAPLDAAAPDARGRDNRGAYAFIELPGSEARRLAAFARLGLAASRYNTADRFVAAGIVLSRILPARPDDQAGLAVAIMHQGRAARRAARAADTPIPILEANVELTYRAALGQWLAVQPTLQYVRHPGASSAYRDALVLALRLELSASWAVRQARAGQ